MSDGEEGNLDYGRAIRSIRDERGMTLEALAEAAGVSASYLSEVERGLKRPSTDVVAKVADAFGMLPSEFLVFVESQVPIAQMKAAMRIESPMRRAYQASAAPAAFEAAGTPRPSGRTLRQLMIQAEQLGEEDLKTLVDIARRLLKRGKST
jgi:transcriptional regulator with XRE-family HTH domain